MHSIQDLIETIMKLRLSYFVAVSTKPSSSSQIQNILKIQWFWTSNKSLCGLVHSTIIKKVKPSTKTNFRNIHRLSFNFISFSYKQPVSCYFIQVNVSLLYTIRLWTAEELLSCWICRRNHCSVTKICIISKKVFTNYFSIYTLAFTHIYVYTHTSNKIWKRFTFSFLMIFLSFNLLSGNDNFAW